MGKHSAPEPDDPPEPPTPPLGIVIFGSCGRIDTTPLRAQKKLIPPDPATVHLPRLPYLTFREDTP